MHQAKIILTKNKDGSISVKTKFNPPVSMENPRSNPDTHHYAVMMVEHLMTQLKKHANAEISVERKGQFKSAPVAEPSVSTDGQPEL